MKCVPRLGILELTRDKMLLQTAFLIHFEVVKVHCSVQ